MVLGPWGNADSFQFCSCSSEPDFHAHTFDIAVIGKVSEYTFQCGNFTGDFNVFLVVHACHSASLRASSFSRAGGSSSGSRSTCMNPFQRRSSL